MKPGRCATTTTRGGGGSSSTSHPATTRGGSATTPARARTTQPAAPASNVVASNKLPSVFFIAILLGADLESKPGTRRIAKPFRGHLGKRVSERLSSSHHIGAVRLVTCPTSATRRCSDPWGSYVTIAAMRRPATSCLLMLLAGCGAHLSGTETAQDAAGGDTASDRKS